MLKIAPSILSADFSALAEDIKKIEDGGADYIHVDVMDGHFVPNISFGAAVMKSMNGKTSVPYDVHLMIENPLDYIVDFKKAGADIITFHIESSSPAEETVDKIIECGCKAGISIKPATPAEEVLVSMTVPQTLQGRS